MKLDKFVQIAGIAAVLLLVPALPIGLTAASAQTAPPKDTFDLDNTLTASSDSNNTGMTFLGAFGMSMVEGARVTGIVMNDDDKVSVTIANTNNTGESPAVTVVAFSGTMDMMSMLASPGSLESLMNESSFGNSSISAANNTSYNGTMIGSASNNGNNSLSSGNSMSPLGLFENMKTGSSMLPQGWDSPQNITVKLVDNGTGATSPTKESDTTFVFVMIFPFTEETKPATVEG
jgi:hypothetical protein